MAIVLPSLGVTYVVMVIRTGASYVSTIQTFQEPFQRQFRIDTRGVQGTRSVGGLYGLVSVIVILNNAEHVLAKDGVI